MSDTHPSHGFRRDEEGASAVEFALISMVLVTLLVGIVQFGITFMQYLEVVHAAREGARWASIIPEQGVGSVDEVGSVRYRVWAAAPGLAPRLSDEDIRVFVDGVEVEEISPVYDSGLPVQVTIDYDSPVVIPPMDAFFGEDGTVRLTSSATLKVE